MFGLSKKERQQKEREDRIFHVYALLAVERRAEYEQKENAIRTSPLRGQEAAEALSQAHHDYELNLRMSVYYDALRIVAQAERGLICARNQGDFRIFEKEGGR